MFTSARWRLALWFAAALAVILAVVGVAVYFTTRTALFDQVDDSLRSRASTETRLLGPRLPQQGRPQQPLGDIIVGPTFTAGGYFYALVDQEGNLVAGTSNVDPAGLASESTVEEALASGSAFENTDSSTGENLRVYVVPLPESRLANLVLEVGRSVEP